MTSCSLEKLFIVISSGILLAVGSASGAIWTNASEDGLWSTPANWNTNALPVSAEEAVINLTGANAAVVDSNVGRFGWLRVGQGNGTVGQLDILTGGVVDSDGGQSVRIGAGGGFGVVNQSGGSAILSGTQIQLGLDAGSFGQYNLSGGSLTFGRESGGNSGFIGDGGTGELNISGGVFRTRAGIRLGRVTGVGNGTFNVIGSGASEIGIGAHNNLAGRWTQYANNTLRFGIDGGGATMINIVDDNGAGGDVFFADGALLDVGFVSGTVAGTWTVMQWAGTLTNEGLIFSESVDTSIWSWGIVGNELQLTAIPEPGTYALIFGSAMLLIALGVRRRRATK